MAGGHARASGAGAEPGDDVKGAVFQQSQNFESHPQGPQGAAGRHDKALPGPAGTVSVGQRDLSPPGGQDYPD